jgi:hypothetical protein
LNKIASTKNQSHRFNAATYACLLTCSGAFDWCCWTLLRNMLENHPLNSVILPIFLLVTSHLSLFSVTKNVTRHICHISGKNVTLSHTKIFFLTGDVFCHILPGKRHILAPPVQKNLNGKKCDDLAGTERWFSLPVSGLSLISEAWSGKAIWAKTYPKTITTQTACGSTVCHEIHFNVQPSCWEIL